MWRDLVAWIRQFTRLVGTGLHLAMHFSQLALQQVNLLLLPEKGTVQFLQMIFCQTELEFELAATIFHGIFFVTHRPPGHAVP